ncbi:hypothetical protein V1264_024840 [Littorina saxatilis]|uniref:Uncharacterized protein n=1 Tax=Littorina saxatilis TaxID=31220 RepID=A0AAN9AN44_9CAEN
MLPLCPTSAGQQSRLGVSSGRQSRVNRRASAPISIWTIAEVGEEDHAPRFGMDRNHALRSGKDVVPEADQPLAEVEDHDGETVEKAVKNCLEFLNEHMLESSVSDPEGYLGDTEDKICEERMTLHKQQNVEATSDDDLDEYSEYGAGIVEGESLSLSVDECMYISLDQGPSDKTMSSVVPEDQIGEASGTDTQSNVVVTVLLGVDELLISHKDQTTGESPCDMDGYLGDAEDTSCSAVPEESSAEGILGDSQGYLGDIDDTETQEIFSVSYEDRQSTEDSLGDSENCHSEKTDVKTPDVCSPQEEQADLRLTRDEQGTKMKNEETVMLGPEDTQRSDLQTDNPAGAEIPDNNIDTSQCRDLSTRHFANETPDQMCHEEKSLPLNVVVGITEELPFPGDFDEEHQDSMNTCKDDVQDEKNTNGANQTKNSNCALDDRSETKKDLTMISIFNVTQHCDLENRNQGLGEPPFDAKHADEEAVEVLRTCETFEGEPETDLVEQKTQDNVHHVQSETKPDELGETQLSVREAEQDIGVREQSDDVQSSECRAVKDSGEEAIHADTLHADSQTVNCSATHGTGDGGAQHDMCETAQDIVYEQPRGTQRSDSEASKNNSDGKTYDDALNLEIQTLMDLVESDPVGDKQHSECKEAVGMPKGPELSDGQAMARQSAFQNSADAQDGEYEITTPSLDVLVAFQNSDCGDSVSVMSHASCEKVEANEADVTQGNESCMAESLPSEHACLPEQNSEKNVETSIPVLGSQEEVAPCFNKDISAGEDYSPKRQAPDNFILEGPGQQRSLFQTFPSSSSVSPAEHHRDMRQDITTHHQSSTDTSVSKNPLRENDRLIPNTNIPSPKIALDKRDDGNTEHLSECADLFGGPGDKHNDQSLDISGLPDNEFFVRDSICRFHDDSESTEASFAVCHTPSSTQSYASQPQCSSSVKTDDGICSATPESTIAEGFSAADESTADTSNSNGIESAIGSSNISIVEPAIDESISATVKLTADKFGSANDEPSVDKDCGASIEPGDHETCSAKPTADESSDETVEPSAAKNCGKTVQAIIDETLETLFQPAADERYGTTFEAIGSGSCDAAVEHNVEENCSDTAEPVIDREYRRQNEATVRDDCKKHAVHVNEHVTVTAGSPAAHSDDEHVTVTAGSPAAHSNDEHVTVTAGSPAAHSNDEHVTVTAGSPAAHSNDEHVTVTAGSPAAHSNDEHLQKRTNSPSGFQDDDENKMDSDEHDGYCSDLAARSVHSESDPDDAVHPSNRSSCREPNNSQHSKEVLLSKSRVPADTSRGGEPDSPRALGKKLRKGSVGGGTAQVYPQVAADSAQQPLSAHGSEEELWACPASMTSSVPAASSPRVTFACDVIEEI